MDTPASLKGEAGREAREFPRHTLWNRAMLIPDLQLHLGEIITCICQHTLLWPNTSPNGEPMDSIANRGYHFTKQSKS